MLGQWLGGVAVSSVGTANGVALAPVTEDASGITQHSQGIALTNSFCQFLVPLNIIFCNRLGPRLHDHEGSDFSRKDVKALVGLGFSHRY